MNYFFIALLTTSGAAIVLYFLLNKVLRIKMRIIPLILCVACSLFVSMALPKVIIRYSDWMGTLGVLSVFSVIFAYFLAYYDEKLDDCTQKSASETALCLSEPTPLEAVSAALFVQEQEMVQGSANHFVCETEIVNPPCEQSCLEEQASLSVETVSVNEAFSTPETFDEQLELAFHLKEQQDYHSAAKLFQKVLDANPHSEAAPLVILQIVDSLKHAREYQQAIKLLSDSLNFSAIHGNIAIERQIHELLSKLQQLQESEETGGSNT